MLRGTIAPLGYALARGWLPEHLGISGVGHDRLYAPLVAARPSLCTFERESPRLPRCRSACFESIEICTLRVPTAEAAWTGQATLDERLGFEVPTTPTELPLVSRPAAAATPPPPRPTTSELRVVLALRRGRRYLRNVDDLLQKCAQRAAAMVRPLRVNCSAHALGELPPSDVVALLRAADVFVAMHGGDVSNGLHLRPGSAVLEVINRPMAHRWATAGAVYRGVRYDSWLEQNRQVMFPLMRFERLLAEPPSDAPAKDWNDDAVLPWETLERALVALVSAPDPFAKLRALQLRYIVERQWTRVCCGPGQLTPLLMRAVNLSFAQVMVQS